MHSLTGFWSIVYELPFPNNFINFVINWPHNVINRMSRVAAASILMWIIEVNFIHQYSNFTIFHVVEKKVIEFLVNACGLETDFIFELRLGRCSFAWTGPSWERLYHQYAYAFQACHLRLLEFILANSIAKKFFLKFTSPWLFVLSRWRDGLSAFSDYVHQMMRPSVTGLPFTTYI